MASGYGRAVGGGCLRGLLVQLVVMGIAIGALFCCAGLAALAPVDRDLRPMLVVVTMMGWLVAMVGGAFVFAVVNRRRIARRVDGAFAPLGLRGEPQMTIGRQVHGEVGGRRLDAYFQKGPSLELILQARAGTRVALAPGSAFVRMVQGATGKDRFDAGWPELAEVSVSADEGAWARALLADPPARAALASLLHDGEPALRVASVQPGAVALVVRGSSLDIVDGDQVPRAVAALAALAERVEAQPAPATWQEPSPLSQRLRQRRPGPGLALIVAGATVVGVTILSGLVALAVAFSDR